MSEAQTRHREREREREGAGKRRLLALAAHVEEAAVEPGGNVSATAERLGVSRGKLLRMRSAGWIGSRSERSSAWPPDRRPESSGR
jgi:hypothetical protein